MSIYSLVYSDLSNDVLENTPQASNVFTSGISSQLIQSGDCSYNANLVDGYMQSGNFITGTTGWRISASGDVEFESGYFRGDISAATGSFGGTVDWDNVNAGTNENALSVGDAKVLIDGSNKRIIINDGTNDRILIGYLSGKF
jgi:hypothetical protein